jgi:chromodomain-helicase-DNA-binding protein 7
VEHIRGPFLIVVPLSTLTHWKREVELWTDMNGILYHDPVKGKETRRFMREHEFWYQHDAQRKQVKFNILITSYEVFLADLSDLVDIKWKYVIIDEGHRIKNKSAKLLEALKQLRCNRRLLMSGTPIQNNTSELWTLMNFLQPEEFHSQRDFADRFGALERNQQVSELQAMLKPYMLRRMKEAVEKSIPPKDETIVDIELTTLQKQYYRAIYDKNLKFLRIVCYLSHLLYYSFNSFIFSWQCNRDAREQMRHD